MCYFSLVPASRASWLLSTKKAVPKVLAAVLIGCIFTLSTLSSHLCPLTTHCRPLGIWLAYQAGKSTS